MKKLLIIDNTFDPPHGCPEIREHLEKAAKGFGEALVETVRAPEGKIPSDLSGYAGVVLSGSKTRIAETEPWIEAEMAAIRQLHEWKIPTLGICYGEQLIARTLGGDTGAARQYEYGWVEIEQKATSPIFEGLPKRFYSFEFHSDEVRSLPKGCVLAASSQDCPVQAYEVEGAPIWCVQFHPERGLEHGNRSLRNWASKNERVINGDRGAELYDQSVGDTIFRNFLRLVWNGRG